jgi:hypothetical protein
LVELLSALEAVLEVFDQVYIVIDAIDESKSRGDLLRVLRDLAIDPRFQNVRLFATSREYIEIENSMYPISVSMAMSDEFVDVDIKIYARSQMDSNPKFKHWPPALRDEVVDTLARKAHGM